MKPNIFTDLAAGVKAVMESRNSRLAHKGNAAIDLTPRLIPVYDFGYWSWTIESTLFTHYDKPLRDAVKRVFHAFDEETQHKLCFAPKTGEVVGRMQLWQKALHALLPPEQAHTAMLVILDWFIHIRTGHNGLFEYISIADLYERGVLKKEETA